MRIRYSTDEKGRPVKQAEIYTAREHGINPDLIDEDAYRSARRLKDSGYECYVVGGAVRDLLLGRKPKDFDLATNALPGKIKKLFRNAWIIGRRFRLVHLRFNNNKIIEVATFRSAATSGAPVDRQDPHSENNQYGTLAEDVYRRDFSLNALYYDPVTEELIDFVGGYRDVKKHRIIPVVPLDITFDEDPVRMLRAVKYSVITDSRIPRNVLKKIRAKAMLLSACSSSRLSEELFKILEGGESSRILEALVQTDLLKAFLPAVDAALRRNRALCKEVVKALSVFDEQKAEGKELGRGVGIAAITGPLLAHDGFFVNPPEEGPEAAAPVKKYLLPLIAPNKDIDDAVDSLYKAHGLKSPTRKPRRRWPERRRRPKTHH